MPHRLFWLRPLKKNVRTVDLIFCGAYTSDSETAQVGPQLAEELNMPAAAYAENLEISGRTLRVRRLVDNFRETLEMEFPALVTISMEKYEPRYTSFAGLEKAFKAGDITILDADALGITGELISRAVPAPTCAKFIYAKRKRKM